MTVALDEAGDGEPLVHVHEVGTNLPAEQPDIRLDFAPSGRLPRPAVACRLEEGVLGGRKALRPEMR